MVRRLVAGAVVPIALVVAIFFIRPTFGVEGMFCTLSYPPPPQCMDQHVAERVMVAIVGLVSAAVIAFLPFRRSSAANPPSN